MSDTPRTDVAEHNMGSIVEPHYVVDADFSRYLERELVAARAELAEAQAEKVVDALRAALAEPEQEYICKCGLRVTPHWCKTDKEF